MTKQKTKLPVEKKLPVKTTWGKQSAAFKKRNAKFKAATKAEKRVMIARDVLAQIRGSKITAEHMVWANLTSKKLKPEQVIKANPDVCNLIESPDVKCTCCALGALMLSEIRHTDNLKVKTVVDQDLWFNTSETELIDSCTRAGKFDFTLLADDDFGARKEDRLGRYFSQKQLRLMEIAFESGEGGRTPNYDDADERRAVLKYKSKRAAKYAKEILVDIMQNVIKNKGTFIP